MPEEGVLLSPKEDLLTFDELVRLGRVFADHGVTKIRFTGGEPLLYSPLAELIGSFVTMFLFQFCIHLTSPSIIHMPILYYYYYFCLQQENLNAFHQLKVLVLLPMPLHWRAKFLHLRKLDCLILILALILFMNINSTSYPGARVSLSMSFYNKTSTWQV